MDPTPREGAGTDPPDDDELVARARGGDADAFSQLAERHRRRAYGAAFHVLRDQDEALDVTQDALLKAYRKLDSFEGRSSFATWLGRIATNTALNRAKQRRRERDRTGAELPEGDILTDPRAAGPVITAMGRELREHLAEAVKELPPEQRAALLLCDVEGRSYAEIAEILDCPKGTVMSRIHYARTKLRGLLRGHEDRAAGARER